MNSNFKQIIILCCLLQGFQGVSAFARIKVIEFEENPIKIYVQWLDRPVEGAKVSICNYKDTSIIVSNESDKNGEVEIKLPQKKNYFCSKKSTFAYIRIFYKPEMQRIYENIDSTILAKIVYNNKGTLSEIKINLLPKVNIQQSELYLDELRKYAHQMNRYKQQYVQESDSLIMLSKFNWDLILQYETEFRRLSQYWSANKDSLTSRRQTNAKTEKLIDNIHYVSKLLKIQDQTIKSDVKMSSIAEFSTYYDLGGYQLEELSDEVFSDIYNYLKKLRYRYDTYREWIRDAGLTNVRLKVILKVTGYADNTPFYSCDNLANQCNLNQKSMKDSCNQCLAYLRAGAIANYLSRNCTFNMEVNTNAVIGSHPFDREHRKTTIASTFIIETDTKDTKWAKDDDDLSTLRTAMAIQFAKTHSTTTLPSQYLLDNGNNVNVNIIRNSSPVSLHAFIITSKYQKNRIIKHYLEVIAEKANLKFVSHEVNYEERLDYYLQKADISNNDVVFIFFEGHGNLSTNVKTVTQRNRLVFLVSDLSNEGTHSNYLEHGFEEGDLFYTSDSKNITDYRPDTVYDQLFNQPRHFIKLNFKKEINFLYSLISIIEIQKLSNDPKKLDWEDILKVMHKQDPTVKYTIERLNLYEPTPPSHKMDNGKLSPISIPVQHTRTGQIHATPDKVPKQSFD
jgi:hypothetical protein